MRSEELRQSGQLLTVTPNELGAAWRSYRAGHIGGPGLVDLVSMLVMEREEITQVLTNDRHFAEAGFRPLY